jgi:hypothetical protein
MISRRPPTHVLCFGGRGAGLRNEDKHRRGALPIAQQRVYAIASQQHIHAGLLQETLENR